MTEALGIVGIAVFIVCVIALAAGVTWLVVKLSPGDAAKKRREQAT
jgi:hypothetical protein